MYFLYCTVEGSIISETVKDLGITINAKLMFQNIR